MFERKKTVTEKPWQTCYVTKSFCHNKIQDNKRFKRIKRIRNVTEVLIFRSSRSQMFFKRGALKNLSRLEPLSNKVADLLLQNTYGGCFQIFVVANTFFQLNLVFIADSRTDFYSWVPRKHELNLRSSHWSHFVKKVFLEIWQIVQENT